MIPLFGSLPQVGVAVITFTGMAMDGLFSGIPWYPQKVRRLIFLLTAHHRTDGRNKEYTNKTWCWEWAPRCCISHGSWMLSPLRQCFHYAKLRAFTSAYYIHPRAATAMLDAPMCCYIRVASHHSCAINNWQMTFVVLLKMHKFSRKSLS